MGQVEKWNESGDQSCNWGQGHAVPYMTSTGSCSLYWTLQEANRGMQEQVECGTNS